MLRIVLAGLATDREQFDPSAVVALLEPACRLLDSTSPALIAATDVSAPATRGETEALALEAARLAAGYGLIATVTVRRSRFYVRFVRQTEADDGHDGR